MKTIYSTIAIILFAVSLCYPQTMNGFKGKIWGAAVSEFKEFSPTKVQTTGNSIYYKINLKSLGNVKINKCIIGFYKGKFYSVSIKTKGYANSRALLELWTAAYGKPYQDNEYIEEYTWLNIGGVATATYEENSVTNDASLVYINDQIINQRILDKQNAAENNKSDL